jgi:hypothetical protein
VIVHARGEAMDGADEGAFAATHHSQTNPCVRALAAAAFDWHVLFLSS